MNKMNKGVLRIDGDGIGANSFGYVHSVFKKHADVVAVEVYVKVGSGNYKGWMELSKTHGVTVIPLPVSSGKNAVDIEIALQTSKDLFFSHRINVYGIAASDYDFSPIAREIRKRGCELIGFGFPQTPPEFQTKCTSFELLSKQIIEASNLLACHRDKKDEPMVHLSVVGKAA